MQSKKSRLRRAGDIDLRLKTVPPETAFNLTSP